MGYTNQRGMNMTIATFDKAVCQSLRAELTALLAKYGEAHGVEFAIGNIRFTSESADLKLSVKVKGGKTIEAQKVDAALQLQAKLNDLLLTEVSGKVLTGYNSRSHKYPFIYKEVSTGKFYKCNKASALYYFGKKLRQAA